MTLPAVTILEAMAHPGVWRPWFRDPATWAPWRSFLAALFGLPMSEDDLAVYRHCTGRDAPPLAAGFVEAWLVCGRRAGKSFILALIACYLAIFRDWRAYLSPGEVGTIKVMAVDRKQARTIHRYCRALLTKVPALGELVAHDGDEEIELTNGIVIEIQTASFRSVRGYTVIAALCDEIAYWPNDEGSANPDGEILAALRPAMATVPRSMLLAASSPYARRGELWQAYRRHHGRDDAPALCWQAATRDMNPSVPQSIVDEALAEDPAKASAEFLAQFRSDIESFISREVVDAAVAPDRHELPPVAGVSYVGFADPSGGSVDAFTLAIAHREQDGRAILDCIRERRPPFSPEAVTQEFADVLKSYGVHRVTGDRYAGEWPKEQFRKRAVEYIASDKSKSAIYQEALPLLNSGKVELLENRRLIVQLCGLERRTARGGRDSIDHAPGAHDDLINAAAGALVLATAERRPIVIPADLLARSRIPPPPRGLADLRFGSF